MAQLLVILSIFAGLYINFIHGHDVSCSKKGLIQCDTNKRCYEVRQRCNGFWDCADHSDEFNCTSTTHSGFSGVSKGQNLAWLVTPVLLLLGLAYGIYKCVRDGVCGAIRRRIMQGCRNRENHASDYHPLHQVSFYTSTQIPCTQLGISLANLTPQQQMMLIHNQSFSIRIQGTENPGLVTGIPRFICVQGANSLPSYEEATATLEAHTSAILVTKNGDIVSIAPGAVHPPPYPGTSVSHSRSKRTTPSPSTAHMDAIEEVDDEDRKEDNDEETFSLLTELRTDRHGRRRHHSQWSQKHGSANRRRHHSCPS